MNAYKAQGQPLCTISKFYKKPRRFVNYPHYTEDEMEAERPCPGSRSLTSPSCTFLVCKVGITLPTFRGGWRKVPAVLGTLPLASGCSLHPPHQPQPPTWRYRTLGTQNQLGNIFPSERRLVAGLGCLDLRVQKQPGQQVKKPGEAARGPDPSRMWVKKPIRPTRDTVTFMGNSGVLLSLEHSSPT